MIELAGGQNAVRGFSGYKPLTPEAVLVAAPDFILTASHVVAALGSIEALTKHPDLSLTPAGKEGRIIVRDSLFLLGFGPRLGEAALDLARALHPTAGLPKLAALP
jgi:iron complex transport system substrate-binding protein